MDNAYKRTLFSLLNSPGGRDWWNVNKNPDIEADLNFDMGTLETNQHPPVLHEEPVLPPETPIAVESIELPDVETTQQNSQVKKNFKKSEVRKVPEFLPNSENNLDNFEIAVDVEDFEYSEIKVYIVDNFFVIHAEQKDRPQDTGFVSKQLTRKYRIPEGVDVDKVMSFGFEPGLVKIVCPRKIVES